MKQQKILVNNQTIEVKGTRYVLFTYNDGSTEVMFEFDKDSKLQNSISIDVGCTRQESIEDIEAALYFNVIKGTRLYELTEEVKEFIRSLED